MNSDSPTLRSSAVALSDFCPWIRLHLQNLFQLEASSGYDLRSSTQWRLRDTLPLSSVLLPFSCVSFGLGLSPRSMSVSRQTSWMFPQDWKRRPTTSDSRGRWMTDPFYRGTWSPRHMKVRMQCLNERFWGTRLTECPTESMLWLEGRRSLDANQSLTNP